MLIIALGIKRRHSTHCDRDNENKVENAIPLGYDQNIFCAKNPNQKDYTCPGGSFGNGQLPVTSPSKGHEATYFLVINYCFT